MFRIGAQVRVVPGHLRRDMTDLRHDDFNWDALLDRVRDVGMAKSWNRNPGRQAAFLRLSQAEFHEV